jgi:hypothetical protein
VSTVVPGSEVSEVPGTVVIGWVSAGGPASETGCVSPVTGVIGAASAGGCGSGTGSAAGGVASAGVSGAGVLVGSGSATAPEPVASIGGESTGSTTAV